MPKILLALPAYRTDACVPRARRSCVASVANGLYGVALMDQAWVNDLLAKLGPRYRLGNPQDGGAVLLYRYGKAEFRQTRVVVGSGALGRGIELIVDFRIPRDAEVAGSEPLLTALEQRSLDARNFVRIGEEIAAMTTESGKESGFVRSVRYHLDGADAKRGATAIRAIIESIDMPVVLGVHDVDDMVARDPTDAPKKLGRLEPMEKWEYTLAGGMLKSLTAIVDPNVRTVVVVERKLVSTKEISETVMLAHVAKFVIAREANEAVLRAEKKDGGSVDLCRSAYKDDFVATAERLAKKVMIPLAHTVPGGRS
jgi:hypothetical protein